MSGINVTTSGSHKGVENFLKRMNPKGRHRGLIWLEPWGVRGVDALTNATPRDTGATANRWNYKVTERPGEVTLSWHNDNTVDQSNIAILIQYGHSTGTGGFVQGRDYINPALRPIFDQIADEIWKKVKK